MEKYLNQLIEDLEKAAENPPSPAFIEPPPHLDDLPDVAELALVPFKPISEWTGIDPKYFPELIHLTADQADMVNKAIFKLFESLNIELVDIPKGIPPEMLYDVLVSNWNEPVQYLPLAGFDLELCTGDWMTCPYGDYCDCDEEPDFSLDDDMPSNRNEDEDADELLF